tara:strand:- start:13 stop:1137 length:1125 start_codon:yes stop_codon:yes gene_type:complete
MGYIGQAPTDVPLTGSDLADGIINSAKIADGTIASVDLAAGVGGTNYSGRNDIINGGLVVNQENVTAPADADFTIGDLFLHNGEGTPVMSLETDGPQGTRPWQKMVLDANAQGGLAYIVPNDTVQDYIADGKMSFGIQLKTTAATIANARIGVIKWTGTADAVTKELVGTWASDGTSPTLGTSLSYENTPANLGLTTSWARHVVEDVTVDSDTKNIILFVWTDDGTITASDVIGFSEWQLNPGSTVNDFSSGDAESVRGQINPYLHREDYDQVSSQVISMEGGCNATVNTLHYIRWEGEMRSIPVVTSTVVGTFAFSDYSTNGQPATSLGFSNVSRYGCQMNCVHSGFVVGRAVKLTRDGTDTCWIQADSRIGV